MFETELGKQGRERGDDGYHGDDVSGRGHTERRRLTTKEEWDEIDREIDEMFVEEKEEEEKEREGEGEEEGGLTPDETELVWEKGEEGGGERWEDSEGEWWGEGGWVGDPVTPVTPGSAEWNQDQRNLLLELGLAEGRNGDQSKGRGDSTPEFMGLRLLSVDHLKTKTINEIPDIHQD